MRPGECSVDISPDNVVLMLVKDGQFLRKEFEAGLNATQCQVGKYYTYKYLKKSLK